jgi:hypothetical protein
MNETKIVCKWVIDIDYSIDLELDLTIVPNVGDVYLFSSPHGTKVYHLKAVKRQIVKSSIGTSLIVSFKEQLF